MWSLTDALNLSFSRIISKTACLNPCAPNLKRPDFPRVGGKVKFQLLEISDDLYSLNKNRIAVSVLV